MTTTKWRPRPLHTRRRAPVLCGSTVSGICEKNTQLVHATGRETRKATGKTCAGLRRHTDTYLHYTHSWTGDLLSAHHGPFLSLLPLPPWQKQSLLEGRTWSPHSLGLAPPAGTRTPAAVQTKPSASRRLLQGGNSRHSLWVWPSPPGLAEPESWARAAPPASASPVQLLVGRRLAAGTLLPTALSIIVRGGGGGGRGGGGREGPSRLLVGRFQLLQPLGGGLPLGKASVVLQEDDGRVVDCLVVHLLPVAEGSCSSATLGLAPSAGTQKVCTSQVRPLNFSRGGHACGGEQWSERTAVAKRERLGS